MKSETRNIFIGIVIVIVLLLGIGIYFSIHQSFIDEPMSCNLDLDCGGDYYIGSQYCIGDDMYQQLRTPYCVADDGNDGMCGVSTEEFLLESNHDLCNGNVDNLNQRLYCGGDTSSSWSCESEGVIKFVGRTNTISGKYCTYYNSGVTSNYNGCITGFECQSDGDCSTSASSDNKYCSGNDLITDTPNSYCDNIDNTCKIEKVTTTEYNNPLCDYQLNPTSVSDCGNAFRVCSGNNLLYGSYMHYSTNCALFSSTNIKTVDSFKCQEESALPYWKYENNDCVNYNLTDEQVTAEYYSNLQTCEINILECVVDLDCGNWDNDLGNTCYDDDLWNTRMKPICNDYNQCYNDTYSVLIEENNVDTCNYTSGGSSGGSSTSSTIEPTELEPIIENSTIEDENILDFFDDTWDKINCWLNPKNCEWKAGVGSINDCSYHYTKWTLTGKGIENIDDRYGKIDSINFDGISYLFVTSNIDKTELFAVDRDLYYLENNDYYSHRTFDYLESLIRKNTKDLVEKYEELECENIPCKTNLDCLEDFECSESICVFVEEEENITEMPNENDNEKISIPEILYFISSVIVVLLVYYFLLDKKKKRK